MAQYLQSRIEDPIWLEPNDASFLRTRISEEEVLVETFESQMDELRSQISELTLQKDAKLVEIASLRNVLAPVRRVPLEILTEIFDLVTKGPQWEIVSHLFILSSVCVAWRKAAHAIPRLWSTLHIDMDTHFLGSDYTWVNGWFTHSQMVPVDLNFYMDELNELRVESGKQFLEYILVHFAHKIRLLAINRLCALTLLPLLCLSPSSSLILLEEMSFSVQDDQADFPFFGKVEAFLSAPKLRRVELSNAFLLEFLVLPVEQLISLKVNDDETDFDPVMFVDILPRCKQLVSLEISLPPEGFIGFSTRLSILLPTLRSLEVTCYNAADNILRCITTPLLERLSIRYYYNRDLDGLVVDMTAFQQRSSTALLSLVFYPSITANRGHKVTEKVIAILALFPTIRSLGLHPPFDVNAIMQAMICTHRNQVLSNLQELTLNGYPNYHRTENKGFCLSGSVFKAMILSRWWLDGSGSTSFRNGLSCLQKVTLRGFRVSDSAGDISHVSALSGLVLDYTPE